jgi:hypothetical protein
LAGDFLFGAVGLGGDFRFTAAALLVDAFPRLGAAILAFDAGFAGLFCGLALPFFEALTDALPIGFFGDLAAIDRYSVIGFAAVRNRGAATKGA